LRKIGALRETGKKWWEEEKRMSRNPVNNLGRADGSVLSGKDLARTERSHLENRGRGRKIRKVGGEGVHGLDRGFKQGRSPVLSAG